MIDLYIWIAVWVLILIMFIIELGKVESRLAEDRINKMFEDLKKQKGERMTMPRYIEENELREWIQNWFEKNRYYHPYSRSNDIPIPELYDILERMPPANVPERKVGKWKLNREGNWACPFCEFDPYHDEMNGMNYCPNCGAKLEGFDNGKVH